MAPTSDGADVVVGVVGKPFGLRGDVYVRPEPDVVHALAAGDTLTTQDGSVLVVAAVKEHSGRRVMRFAGVDDRDAAEGLRGTILHVPREAVSLEDDSFWTDELLGMEVVDESGGVIGVLEATLDGAAHDYLVVARPDGGEILVPAVADLVTIETDRVVVHPIPGLIDAEG